MNDSHAVLADMYSALAAERTRSMLSEAHDDGLARLSRRCSPHRVAAARTYVAAGIRQAGHASVAWLRKGQLAGPPSVCTTC